MEDDIEYDPEETFLFWVLSYLKETKTTDDEINAIDEVDKALRIPGTLFKLTSKSPETSVVVEALNYGGSGNFFKQLSYSDQAYAVHKWILLQGIVDEIKLKNI